MPDITKCVGEYCLIKENCYRYTAKDSYYQSYSDFSIGWIDVDCGLKKQVECDADCKNYIDNKGRAE